MYFEKIRKGISVIPEVSWKSFKICWLKLSPLHAVSNLRSQSELLIWQLQKSPIALYKGQLDFSSRWRDQYNRNRLSNSYWEHPKLDGELFGRAKSLWRLLRTTVDLFWISPSRLYINFGEFGFKLQLNRVVSQSLRDILKSLYFGLKQTQT